MTSNKAGHKGPPPESDFPPVLSQLWLLDPVPGWVRNRKHLRRLTQAPKHHLADQALAAHLVGIDAGALLRGQSAGLEVPRDGTLLEALSSHS
jgi:uncharacterized protein